MAVIPIVPESPYQACNVVDYNAIQKRCCREVPECYYLNVFDQFINPRTQWPYTDTLRHDGVHPTYIGSGILARAFIKVVRNGMSELH